MEVNPKQIANLQEYNRSSNLFQELQQRELTEAEQSIIQEQVLKQRKLFEEYEKRDITRKITEIQEIIEGITEQEASLALKLCDGREEIAIEKLLTDASFQRLVRGTSSFRGAAIKNDGESQATRQPQRTRNVNQSSGPFKIDGDGQGIFMGRFKGKLGPLQQANLKLFQTRKVIKSDEPPMDIDAFSDQILKSNIDDNGKSLNDNNQNQTMQIKDGATVNQGQNNLKFVNQSQPEIVHTKNEIQKIQDQQSKKRKKADEKEDIIPIANGDGKRQRSFPERKPVDNIQDLPYASEILKHVQNSQSTKQCNSSNISSKTVITKNASKEEPVLDKQSSENTAQSKKSEQEPIQNQRENNNKSNSNINSTQIPNQDLINTAQNNNDARSDGKSSEIINKPKKERKPRQKKDPGDQVQSTQKQEKVPKNQTNKNNQSSDDKVDKRNIPKQTKREVSQNLNDSQQSSQSQVPPQNQIMTTQNNISVPSNLQNEQIQTSQQEQPVGIQEGKQDRHVQFPQQIIDLSLNEAQNNANRHLKYYRDKTETPHYGRIKQKGVKKAELLNVGTMRAEKGWYNSGYIFPEGFETRTVFRSSVQLDTTCLHTCQILEDPSRNKKGITPPLFRVIAADRPDEPIDSPSCTGCWTGVLKRIREEINFRISQGEDLPPPPKTAIAGPEYFGLNQRDVVQLIEAQDPDHLCKEYWQGKEALTAAIEGQSSNYNRIENEPKRFNTTKSSSAQGNSRAANETRSRNRRNYDDLDDEDEYFKSLKWSGVDRAERYKRRQTNDIEDNNATNFNNYLIDDDNPLPNYLDPITLEPVVTPAISPYGHVMGMATWKAVLAEQSKCPFTKKPLKPEQCKILNKINFSRYEDKIINIS